MNVAISKISSSYPTIAPFNPSIKYPEYRSKEISNESNEAYSAVRETLVLLGLDKEKIDTPDWNPLGDIIKPGNTVFIKPNFVDNKHRYNENIWSVITHPSVIRAAADYVALALKGNGKIIIGDNPHVDAKFETIRDKCSLDMIANIYRQQGIECEVVDLRKWHMPDLKYYGFKEGRIPLRGDPNGATTLNVGKKSYLKKRIPILFHGTYTDRSETIRHHIFNKHEYVFSNSILSADVYVSIPKLKSHAKVGATLNIKGLIGAISEKNSLVHWSIGYPLMGGDEYPPPAEIKDYFKLYFQHLLLSIIPSKIYFYLRNYFNKTRIGEIYNRIISTGYQKDKMLRGAWEGNDTTWRMTADVYNAFVKDITGLRKEKGWPFKGFSIVDGIVGGDTDGPHYPHPIKPGVIISGEDLLAVDATCARLMDYNIEDIKYLKALLNQYHMTTDDINVLSRHFECNNFFGKDNRYLGFRPPHNWPNLSSMNLQPRKPFMPTKHEWSMNGKTCTQ
jgi:uncharacterized protein (DUF362 family)